MTKKEEIELCLSDLQKQGIKINRGTFKYLLLENPIDIESLKRLCNKALELFEEKGNKIYIRLDLKYDEINLVVKKRDFDDNEKFGNLIKELRTYNQETFKYYNSENGDYINRYIYIETDLENFEKEF